MARLLATFSCALVIGCSSHTDGVDGAASDAATDLGVASCSAAFGAPQTLSTALVGQTVILAGMLQQQQNEVLVEPMGTQCTTGSYAIVLITAEAPNEPVQISHGTDVYCGCPDTQSASCGELLLGSAVLVKGMLSRQENGTCNQIPCYHLELSASCAK